MHTLTLKIKDNAYDKILYFLKNLSNDVEILNDKITAQNTTKKQSLLSLGGALNKYADPSKIDLEDKVHMTEHPDTQRVLNRTPRKGIFSVTPF
ncbi:hypothetical protein [Sulfurimonas sp. NWX79]|uniref:hypothetical protein n=1 Tax=Sulfurimonas sp. NWX79 TaxID=2925412 RepID=UPI003204785B